METNYKYLFVFIKECDGYNLYWTMCGDYTDRSIEYRLPNNKMRIQYGTSSFNELSVIECRDEDEAVDLQRSMNEIFKLWQNGGGSIIKINMKPETFIECLKAIHKVMNDNNKMLDLFNYVATKYERYNKYSGYVYFIKCENNKLKIGETGDLDYRWYCLKLEEQNKALDIIDTISVSDRKFVEAKLHILCRDYKTDGNKERTNCKERRKLSELFTNCEDVINIWNNYWESYKEFKSNISQTYLNYLRTGKWVE
jgi:hypothetical protein